MLVSPITARFWRTLLALMLASDAVILAVWTHRRAPGHLAGPEPPWIDGLVRSPSALAALAALACLGAFAFARRPGRALTALLAVACTHVLIDAFGYVFQDHIRSFFYSGALVSAWALAIIFTRVVLRGHRPGAALDQTLDTTGAAAAAAVLGAIYFNAGLSKLIFGGADWMNSAVIRLTSVLVSPAGGDAWDASLRAFVVDSPSLAATLAIATVALELQGLFFGLGRRARLLSGSGLLAFHIGTFVMSDIVFVQAVILLCAFTFPWAELAQRLHPRATAPTEAVTVGPHAPRRALTLAALVVGFVALAWLVPGAAPASKSHQNPFLVDTTSLPRFGPIHPGLALPRGLEVTGIHAAEGEVRIMVRGQAGEVILAFAPVPGDTAPGPYDVGSAALAWRAASVDMDAVSRSGEALAALLRSAATADGHRDMSAAWHRWREAADAP